MDFTWRVEDNECIRSTLPAVGMLDSNCRLNFAFRVKSTHRLYISFACWRKRVFFPTRFEEWENRDWIQGKLKRKKSNVFDRCLSWIISNINKMDFGLVSREIREIVADVKDMWRWATGLLNMASWEVWKNRIWKLIGNTVHKILCTRSTCLSTKENKIQLYMT